MSNSSIKTTPSWSFQHSYQDLPNIFYVRQPPTPVAKPSLLLFNQALAAELGLAQDIHLQDETTQILAGNLIAESSQPIAQAYAGHQFGHFAMLGDGRAILLGELITPQQQRVDIQLKGAGITPFSRNGDGRAALAPMLREYLISEAMAALGIASTRSLAVVLSGETVYRNEPLHGAILTRVASSHIRVGTFEYALLRNGKEDLQALADYTIARHYPQLRDSEQPYLGLLSQVAKRQAHLIAQWMSVGFIHGVMNTDNMSIAGETIDYGPCAFINRYDPSTVFSSIDSQSRYAYGQQPQIANWNLLRFAETLLPLIDPDQQQAIEMVLPVMQQFADMYQNAWLSQFAGKLGISQPQAEDKGLIEQFLQMLFDTQADFTNSFRALAENNLHQQALFQHRDFALWHQQWQSRLQAQYGQADGHLAQAYALMCQRNPAVIPRNHLVEEALQLAQDQLDLSKVLDLLAVIQQPFSQPADVRYSQAPESEVGYRTFCGT